MMYIFSVYYIIGCKTAYDLDEPIWKFYLAEINQEIIRADSEEDMESSQVGSHDFGLGELGVCLELLRPRHGPGNRCLLGRVPQ